MWPPYTSTAERKWMSLLTGNYFDIPIHENGFSQFDGSNSIGNRTLRNNTTTWRWCNDATTPFAIPRVAGLYCCLYYLQVINKLIWYLLFSSVFPITCNRICSRLSVLSLTIYLIVQMVCMNLFLNNRSRKLVDNPPWWNFRLPIATESIGYIYFRTHRLAPWHFHPSHDQVSPGSIGPSKEVKKGKRDKERITYIVHWLATHRAYLSLA